MPCSVSDSIFQTTACSQARLRVLEHTLCSRTHLRDLAVRWARVWLSTRRPPIRGRRECRAPDAPAAACAEVVIVSTRVSQVTPENTRHSPRNGFNGFLRALPGDRAFLPPSSPRNLFLENLTPASGCQDHTTSPSASAPFVKSASASTASRPASVTIASRPSEWDGTKSQYACF